MATDTRIDLVINKMTYQQAQDNLSSIGEKELIITTDKNIPVPTTSDSGKVVSVNSSGEYELKESSGPSTYIKSASTSGNTLTLTKQDDTTTTFTPSYTDTGATSVEVTGSGNAVTSADYSAATRKMTLTKGTTFLTEHQSLADYATKSEIPISIDGMSGGTLTSALILTGGDAVSGKANIQLDTNGQITAKGTTSTLLGRNSATSLLVGHSSHTLNLRGSATRPTYNGNNMALYSDIPSTYLKNATISNDKLTITKQDNTTVEFEGGGGGTVVTYDADTKTLTLT